MDKGILPGRLKKYPVFSLRHFCNLRGVLGAAPYSFQIPNT